MVSSMYLIIEENPNCLGEERVFSESGPLKLVKKLNLDAPDGKRAWFEVAAVDEPNTFSPAHGVQVEDSGAGNAWLIFGGNWGLRFRITGSADAWSLDNPAQWGTAFKVLDIAAEDIEFENK
jgi:hypothetical protein